MFYSSLWFTVRAQLSIFVPKLFFFSFTSYKLHSFDWMGPNEGFCTSKISILLYIPQKNVFKIWTAICRKSWRPSTQIYADSSKSMKDCAHPSWIFLDFFSFSPKNENQLRVHCFATLTELMQHRSSKDSSQTKRHALGNWEDD